MSGENSASDFSLGAILLAAGRSARMGKPKMLLPWGSNSVLGHLILRWQGLGACQVAVVCAGDDVAIQSELDRLQFPGSERILNEAPEEGMFGSIQRAARWKGWQTDLTHWAIVLGDQPHLGEATLHAVLGSSREHPESVCQPKYAGHRYHPVLLPKAVFRGIATSMAGNLREFLETIRADCFFCELNDPALALDIDRPEDYSEALEKYGPDVSAR